MKKITLILCVGLLFFSSCSDELTRDKAEKILTETFNYPYAEFTKCVVNKNVRIDYGINLVDKASPQSTKPEIVDISTLIDQGFIDRVQYNKQYVGKVYAYSFTDKAKEFLQPGTEIQSSNTYYSGDFAFCTRDFKEVTGIKFNDDKTKATVEFTTIRDNFTPFSIMTGLSEVKEVEYEMEFELYDDGWRVNTDGVDNYEYISASEFEFFDPEYLKNQKEKQQEFSIKIVGKWKTNDCFDCDELTIEHANGLFSIQYGVNNFYQLEAERTDYLKIIDVKPTSKGLIATEEIGISDFGYKDSYTIELTFSENYDEMYYLSESNNPKRTYVKQ